MRQGKGKIYTMSLKFRVSSFRDNAFARNSLVLFAGTMVVNVLNYFYHLVIGRLVSVEVYGAFESLNSFIAIISVPAMTLMMVATKYSASAKAEQDFSGGWKLFSLFNRKILKYGFPIIFLVFLGTPFVRQFFRLESMSPLVLVWIVMFLSFFSAVSGGILNGWQKFRESGAAGIVGAVVKFLAAVVFIKLGFELNGILGGFLLGTIVSYGASVYLLKFLKRKNDALGESKTGLEQKIDTSAIKKYILPVFVGNLAINILGNVDMVLAKHHLDAIQAGHYGALTIVSKIIFFATSVIGTVLFAMASEDYHKKNSSSSTFRYSLLLLFLISGFSTLVYFLFPTFILGTLFGSKYNEVAPFLGWFAVLVSLFSLANLMIQYFLSTHREKIVYWFLVLSLLGAAAVFFLGKNIFAILIMMIVLQLSVVVAGGIYLFFNQKR